MIKFFNETLEEAGVCTREGATMFAVRVDVDDSGAEESDGRRVPFASAASTSPLVTLPPLPDPIKAIALIPLLLLKCRADGKRT